MYDELMNVALLMISGFTGFSKYITNSTGYGNVLARVPALASRQQSARVEATRVQ